MGKPEEGIPMRTSVPPVTTLHDSLHITTRLDQSDIRNTGTLEYTIRLLSLTLVNPQFNL